MFCGCGSGNSNCSECGACRVCAGEAGNDVEGSGQDGAGPVPVRDLIRLDLLAGQQGAERESVRGHRDHRDKFIKRRLAKMGKEARRSRKYAEPMGGSRERRGSVREAQKEDQEKEPGKLTSLGPGMTLSLRVNSASCHQILPFLSLRDALSQDLRRH